MRVLIAIETLTVGGAEKFVVRLAKGLSLRGHKVFIYCLYKNKMSDTLVNSISSKVSLITPVLFMDSIIQRIDSLLFRLGVPIKLRDAMVIKQLNKTLLRENIEIIHSHLFNVDYICARASMKLKINVLSTIHGDYLNFHTKRILGEKIYCNLNFEEKLKFNLQKIRRFVCISDNQLEFFEKLRTDINSIDTIKIYNGYTLPSFEILSREILGIGRNEFIFGMVARGIPEKGWRFAIDAFNKLNLGNTHLILIGDSRYISTLKEQYFKISHIHFVGFAENPLRWINMFDVGLLPSVYRSESLPTSVIEYLALGKPVIASDMGEIGKMIEVNNEPAGILLDVKKNEINVDEFVKHLQTLLLPHQYEVYQQAAKKAYRKFKMDRCIDDYEKQYEILIDHWK